MPAAMNPAMLTNVAVDCAVGEKLMPVDAAFAAIVGPSSPISDVETLPVPAALGRVLATSVSTRIPLPRFDHSAVDGFGLSEGDLGRVPPIALEVTGAVAAGAPARLALRPGMALRLF